MEELAWFINFADRTGGELEIKLNGGEFVPVG